jgi:WD40 repeat protein
VSTDAATPVGDDGVAAAGATAATGNPDVFISYARTDEAFLRQLAKALEERGKDVWVDWDDIPRTADWRARIFRGIEASQTFVAVLTPDLVGSEICREELAHATGLNKRIIPLLRREVDRAATPDALLIPNWIFFRDGDGFDSSVVQLVDALEADLPWLEAHARILVRAGEWEREGRDASFLLRGRDLKEAESWLVGQGSHREAATPLQAEYIVASRRAATRRQRALFAGVALALAVAVVLGVVAVLQRNDAIAQSHVSRSRELAASAIAQLSSDPELSVLLARDAVEVKQTPQAEDALRRSLRESHARLTIDAGMGAVTSAHFSPGGRWIVVAAGKTAGIWYARSGKLLRRLVGHRARVTDAQFAPSGNRVATASADHTVRVWNAATGKTLAVLRDRRRSLRSPTFSPDGSRILTRSSRWVTLWNARMAKPIARMPGFDPTDAVFSRDGSRIVTTTHDGYLRIWDGRTGKRLLVVQANDQDEPTFSPTLSPNGDLVVAANWDFAGVWNARTGTLVKTLVAHAHDPIEFTFTSVSFSRNGKYLVSAGVDSTARVWSTRAWDQVAVLAGHSGIVEDARFSRDGSRVVTVADDGTARIWDTISGENLAVLRVHGATITSAEFARDGNRIATATNHGARVWEASGIRPIRRIALPRDAPRGYHISFKDVVFSPDSRVVATVSDWGPVHLWSATTGRHLKLLAAGRGFQSSATVSFSNDGRRIVTNTNSGVAVWNASTGAKLVGWRTKVRTATFDADGTRVITTEGSGRVRVWDARTGEQVRVVRVADENDYVMANMTISSDSALATGHTERGVTVWEVATGAKRTVLKGTLDQLGGAPAFSADGTRVFADTDNGATAYGGGGVTRAGVWHAASGAQIAAFPSGRALGDGAFSDDGRLVLTRGSSAAEVWDARTGERLATIHGHGSANVDALESASFSPGGRLVITSGTDGTAKVWDSETGDHVATVRVVIRTSQTGVPAARFSLDGTRVLVVSDTSGRLYECEDCGTLAELRQLADRRIARTITPHEQERYLRALSGTP